MRTGGRSGIRARGTRQQSAHEPSSTPAELLQERRRCILGEVERLIRRLREKGRPATGDEGERAAYGLDRELGTARLDQLTQIERQIAEALVRHAEGRYGRCGACEAEIPAGRLRLVPFARYCRDCQEATEAKSRTALLGPIA